MSGPGERWHFTPLDSCINIILCFLHSAWIREQRIQEKPKKRKTVLQSKMVDVLTSL